MKLKSLVAASLVAFASLGAQAATTFAASVNNWGNHDLHEGSGLLAVDAQASFVDKFFFTLSAESLVSSNVAAFGILAGSYGIYNAADSSSTGNLWSFGAAKGEENVVTLGPGSYFFRLNGDTAAGSGVYSLSSAAAAVPVPEPETYALLLAGLGVVGFVARRRKQA